MTIASRIKSIDFYRHVPVDLTEPTAPGAIISVVAALIMFTLFVGEVWSFVSPASRSDMLVAPDQAGSKLRVNLNMTFHKLPCFALGLDVLDALGRHEMGVSNTVRKHRIGSGGDTIGPFQEGNDQAYAGMTSEGCNVEGHIFVNKVPGNFHVSAHGLQMQVMQHLHGHMNLQHTVHELWVGTTDFITKHGYEGEVHPLNGLAQPEETGAGTHYEYFLDIVPTVYLHRGQEERAYQIAASMHRQDIPPGHMPAAMFRYQLSPITVRFSREKRSFIHFVTYVCALVGGVFTVAGILNKMVHRAVVQIQRSALGKDS